MDRGVDSRRVRKDGNEGVERVRATIYVCMQTDKTDRQTDRQTRHTDGRGWMTTTQGIERKPHTTKKGQDCSRVVVVRMFLFFLFYDKID